VLSWVVIGVGFPVAMFYAAVSGRLLIHWAERYPPLDLEAGEPRRPSCLWGRKYADWRRNTGGWGVRGEGRWERVSTRLPWRSGRASNIGGRVPGGKKPAARWHHGSAEIWASGVAGGPSIGRVRPPRTAAASAAAFLGPDWPSGRINPRHEKSPHEWRAALNHGRRPGCGPPVRFGSDIPND